MFWLRILAEIRHQIGRSDDSCEIRLLRRFYTANEIKMTKLSREFPLDGEEVLREAALRMAPNAFSPTCPLAANWISVIKTPRFTLISAMTTAKKIFNDLQMSHGQLTREQVSSAPASTDNQQGALLDYSCVDQAEAGIMRGDPRKAQLGSLVTFCLSNKLNIYGSVQHADFATLVDRAQRKLSSATNCGENKKRQLLPSRRSQRFLPEGHQLDQLDVCWWCHRLVH